MFISVCIEIATGLILTTNWTDVSVSVVNFIQMHSVSNVHVKSPSSTSESTKTLNLLDTFWFKNKGHVPSKRHLYPQDASNCKAKSTKLVIVGCRHLTSQLPCFKYF